MIPLSKKTYILRNIEINEFWEKLDAITHGQKLSPELGYTMPFEGDEKNIFAGRKTGNQFSLYLYRPKAKGSRIEILAKGTVVPEDKTLKVNVQFGIPFQSILSFLFLGSLIMVLIWVDQKIATSVFLTILISGFYFGVLVFNYNEIKQVLQKQLYKIEGWG